MCGCVCVCVRLCKSRGISLALEREKVQIFDQVEKTSYHQNTGLEERDKKCSEKKEEGKLREGFEAWPAAVLFLFACVRDAVVCSRVIITSNSV